MQVFCRVGMWGRRSRRSSSSSSGRSPTGAVPVEERVAVFDNDGTLWCEKPMPIQLDFILRRLVAMAEADPELRERQPWQAAYERDYGWFGKLMAEHYAGDDTNVRTLAAASSPRTTGSASRTSRRSRTPSCARRSTRLSAAGISSARTRRWSSCSATWRRTGSRTTSPRAAAATSCGRSARRCTASRASG